MQLLSVLRKSVFIVLPLIIVIAFLFVVAYKQTTYSVLPSNPRSQLALTPPMGWNGWNHFGCSPDLNEQSFKEMVDALVASGMKDAGYKYVNLDDCWQVDRDTNGQIVVDATRFPSGIKALADYTHSQGLLFGIYTSGGRITCEKRPGSYGYEHIDAKTYADWGVDYIKIDWCGIEYIDTQTQYSIWKQAVENTGRPMVISIAIAAIDTIPNNHVWEWGHGIAESWRTARDLINTWDDVLRVANINTRYASYSRIGGWNDADMLQVGNGGMDIESNRSHFSLWAMMSSPLLAGHDVRIMSPEIRDILTNKEVIAINQDKLGEQAKLTSITNGIRIYSRRLAHTGDRAVALLNVSESEKEADLFWSELGLLPVVVYKDLWQSDGYKLSVKKLTVQLKPHQTILLKIHGFDY